MFLDEATIDVTGGKGGNGCVAWRREKYVPNGGPDGGDGGNGGDVAVIAEANCDTLSNYSSSKRFKAEAGLPGTGKNCAGRSGKYLLLPVPPGTVLTDVTNPAKPRLIADLQQPGDRIVVAKGGRGGYGNTHFKTSVRQAPDFAELGCPGERCTISMELKLVADVGIIGYPSVGKSSLIAAISKARPKIADYPFTTLVPNMGVVRVFDREFVLCDVPGLIKGASEGKGLGDKFLRHIERCGILLHLLDASRDDIVADYRAIRSELKAYSPAFAKATVGRPAFAQPSPELRPASKATVGRPTFVQPSQRLCPAGKATVARPSLSKKRELVVLNKIDLVGGDAKTSLDALRKAKIKVFASISAATHAGTGDLVKKLLPEILKEREKRTAALVDNTLEEPLQNSDSTKKFRKRQGREGTSQKSQDARKQAEILRDVSAYVEQNFSAVACPSVARKRRRDEAACIFQRFLEKELPILRPHLLSSKMGAYRIERMSDGIHVSGTRIEQFTQMTNFSSAGSRQRFRDVVERIGLLKAIERIVTADDAIFIGEVRVDEYLRS